MKKIIFICLIVATKCRAKAKDNRAKSYKLHLPSTEHMHFVGNNESKHLLLLELKRDY